MFNGLTGLNPYGYGQVVEPVAQAAQAAAPNFLSQLNTLRGMGPEIPTTLRGLLPESVGGLKGLAGLGKGVAGGAMNYVGMPLAIGAATSALGHATGFKPLEGIGSIGGAAGIPAGIVLGGGLGGGVAGVAGAGLGEAIMHNDTVQTGLNAIRSGLGMDPLESQNFSLTNLIGPGGALSHIPGIGQEVGTPTDPYHQDGLDLSMPALTEKLKSLNLSPEQHKAAVDAYNKDFVAAQAAGKPLDQALLETYNKYFIGVKDPKDPKKYTTDPALLQYQNADRQAAANKEQSDANAAAANKQSADDIRQARGAIAMQQAFAQMANIMGPQGPQSAATNAFTAGLGPAATNAASLQLQNQIRQQEAQNQAAAIAANNSANGQLVKLISVATPEQKDAIFKQIQGQAGMPTTDITQ